MVSQQSLHSHLPKYFHFEFFDSVDLCPGVLLREGVSFDVVRRRMPISSPLERPSQMSMYKKVPNAPNALPQWMSENANLPTILRVLRMSVECGDVRGRWRIELNAWACQQRCQCS